MKETNQAILQSRRYEIELSLRESDNQGKVENHKSNAVHM
jgi:hypothetical protein